LADGDVAEQVFHPVRIEGYADARQGLRRRGTQFGIGKN
jgi:hypothetical protein